MSEERHSAAGMAGNEMGVDAQGAGQALAAAVETMRRLRAPGGCPWDREQTFDSIRQYTLEETYEVFDAIERRDWPHLEEELGDLLLQVLFYAQMAADAGQFDIAGVAGKLDAKLIRRHPHVFGERPAEITSDGVLRNWEQIKREEKAVKSAAMGAGVASLLDEAPRGLPAALEAQKIGSRAAKVRFDWPDAEGVFAKIAEETEEIRAALAGESDGRDEDVEAEVGDLLFSVVQLARKLGVNAEMALRGSNRRFRGRFAAMEVSAAGGGRSMESMSADELENLWVEAKGRS